MICYNGIALESVAPVQVEDIHVSPIAISPTVRDRPIQPGADFVRAKKGTRTVAITFAVLTENRDARQRHLHAINKWAESKAPAPMQLEDHPGVYLLCICTNKPEPSTRQWWESKLRLVFTAYDPYFLSMQEKSCACGTAFVALGDAEPKMEIRRTLGSAASSQTYGNGSESMSFSQIPAGNLVIDLDRQTAAVNGSSIMDKFGLTSHFLIPKTGSQTITGNGTVYWRERWE